MEGRTSRKPPRTYAFVTLGCKSNQYDSAVMAADLRASGLASTSVPEADLVVVNTCMVTSSTESQCRKSVRQTRRTNPSAFIVVTGCMTALSRVRLEDLSEADLVLDAPKRSHLLRCLGLNGDVEWSDWPPDPAVSPEGRDRAFLKVQDGCDSACSYCVVPLARGPGRSLPPERAIPAILKLLEKHPEVVLSGIHLGRYGADLPSRTTLEDLLDQLLSMEWDARLRLSSIEPLELTEGLLDLVAESDGRICRHLHIPLQSGSDRILKDMGRPYDGRAFMRAVERALERLPGVGIGCDVICGYPGEGETDFAETERMVHQLRIPFLHAFPYSPRPGTKAASLADDVPIRVKKDRVRRLTEAAAGYREEFARSMVGMVLQIVPVSRNGSKGFIGLADNYLKVRLPGRPPSDGRSIKKVRCCGTRDGLLEGHWAGEDKVEWRSGSKR